MRVSRVILSDRKAIEDMLKILDHRISPEDNMELVVILVADTGLADTEFVVTHNLGKTPSFYIVNVAINCVVYDSNRTLWDESTMRLKCSSASQAIKLVVL